MKDAPAVSWQKQGVDAMQAKARKLRGRAEQNAFEKYFCALRGAEREAFIDAVLTFKDDAHEPWRRLFLAEEELKVSPMLEARAVVRKASVGA